MQKQNNNKTLKHLTTQIQNLESEKNTILQQKKFFEYDNDEAKSTLDNNIKNQDLEKKYRQANQENLSLSEKTLENEEEKLNLQHRKNVSNDKLLVHHCLNVSLPTTFTIHLVSCLIQNSQSRLCFTVQIITLHQLPSNRQPLTRISDRLSPDLQICKGTLKKIF